MRVTNQDTKSKRRRITKTDAAYSLLELHSSLVNKTESKEMLAVYTLLDLEIPCHQNENNPASDSTHSTDNNVNEYTQEDHVDTTVENTENVKFKEVETQVNTMVNIH